MRCLEIDSEWTRLKLGMSYLRGSSNDVAVYGLVQAEDAGGEADHKQVLASRCAAGGLAR